MPNGVPLIQVANKPLRDSITFGDGKSPEAMVALSARPTKLLICAMNEKVEAF